MDPCDLSYHDACPCEYSPEFKQAEDIGGRDYARQQTGCIQAPESGTTTSIPFGGRANEFGGTMPQIMSDFDGLILPVLAVSVVGYLLFNSK